MNGNKQEKKHTVRTLYTDSWTLLIENRPKCHHMHSVELTIKDRFKNYNPNQTKQTSLNSVYNMYYWIIKGYVYWSLPLLNTTNLFFSQYFTALTLIY